MTGLDMRELECLLVLGEELHFGRTAERLYLSQGRVSQLLRSLERRIGARLFERTSRRVRPTPLGERLLAELRPAYEAMQEAVAGARAAARGVEGVLRVGFLSGSAHECVIDAVEAFRRSHPGSDVTLVEIPLSDPFGALRAGEVDAAILLLPIDEPDLVVGPAFSKERQNIALSARHPFARRASVRVEELAQCRLLDITGPAPAYWREISAPTVTPDGRPIPRGPAVRTMQEALAMIAADRGGMLFCTPTSHHHARNDIVFVPVEGLPDSSLALVWHRDAETERLRAFTRTIGEL
ncbi:LysR family transcriptional regulator [Actinomadura sp. NPDC047616]|uniref:LysR family transcriptional regulator n=1 Tax=Actinomadura sp. NPDC047616 TaxID=3155914 RepID=UPI0033D35E76